MRYELTSNIRWLIAACRRGLALTAGEALCSQLARIRAACVSTAVVCAESAASADFLAREGLWVRLIDVGAALSARGYATDESIVIDVADDFCLWNAGRARVSRGGTKKTADEPDLACDVAALGCVYLGGFTFAQLYRSMRATDLRTGATARADAMFRSDRAPWCPELF